MQVKIIGIEVAARGILYLGTNIVIQIAYRLGSKF